MSKNDIKVDILDKKFRTIEMVQQIEFLPNSDISYLKNKLELCNFIDDYAYIVHDKDDAKPHFHCLLRMNKPQTLKRLVNYFELDQNRFQKCGSSFANCLAYLTHDTPDSKHKYQYGEENVHANFDFKKEKVDAQKKKNINFRKEELLEKLQKGEIKKYEIDKFFDEYDIDLNYRIYWDRDINIACSIYNQRMESTNSRNMTVIYIHGQSGLGKSSFPKEYSERTNKPMYNTSSNLKDLMSGYAQQPLILWDEVEASLKYSEALKLLDNHTSCSFGSRYKDKPLSCVEILFITSTYSMDEIFNYHDSFEKKQIRRRIPVLFEVIDQETIEVWEYHEDKDEYFKTGNIKNPVKEYIEKHKPAVSRTKEFLDLLHKEYDFKK